MNRGAHPNSRANLKPIRPGEVLNPTGRNQWSNLRGRVLLKIDERLDVLTDRLLDLAEQGDVGALRLCLGSILTLNHHQFVDSDGETVTFRWQDDSSNDKRASNN